MKTLYEVLNVDLAQEYTKKRKTEKANELRLEQVLLDEVIAVIELMNIPEDDEQYHWIQKLGRLAGADLLTLGKVQPETMLAMIGLGVEDFKEAVKVATRTARMLNDSTIAAEKELTNDLVPDNLL
jgi:hypothetical protein